MKAGVASCSFGGVRERTKLINAPYQQGFHGFSVFRLVRTCLRGGEQGAVHNSSSLASFVCSLCFTWLVVWASSGLAKRSPRLLWCARGGLTGWCCCVLGGVIVEAVCFRVEIGPECRFICFYVICMWLVWASSGLGKRFPQLLRYARGGSTGGAVPLLAPSLRPSIVRKNGREQCRFVCSLCFM